MTAIYTKCYITAKVTVWKEVWVMQMTRIQVQLPVALKHKLEALQAPGTTASGFIRWLLEEHFKQAPTAKKGR